MIQIRSNTFETNSSSTHSVGYDRDHWKYKKLEQLFSEILDEVEDAYDDDDLKSILKKLHEATSMIMEDID